MSTWSRKRQGMGENESLDDATAEDLLGGRYHGDAPDLIAVSQFVEQVRSIAHQPAPLPSASLARVLSDSARVSSDCVPTPSRWWLRERLDAPLRRPAEGPEAVIGARRHSRFIVLPVAAACSAIVIAAGLVAGSGRLLPASTQNLVAQVVRTVTPFDLPEQKGPKAVSSGARSSDAAPTSDANTPAHGGSSNPSTAERGTNGTKPVGPDDSAGRSQSNGVNAPPPSATLTPGAAPTVPELAGRYTPPVTSSPAPPPPRPLPPPPPKQRGFSADLIGAIGAQAVGDPNGQGMAVLDANLGSNELCLTLVTSGITPVSSVHLHDGITGLGGPVVAAFPAPGPTDGTVPKCVTASDQLIKKIRKDPGRYYVEVHTTELPNGALRGPLTK